MSSSSPFVSVEDHDGVRLVALCGEHDLSTVDQITAACEGPPRPTVVDLTGATFIDSSVISELITIFDLNANHGFAIAVNPNSHVARVLSLGLLATIMPILDDLNEAITLTSTGATTLRV
jgi:anti-anti-sigma factor